MADKSDDYTARIEALTDENLSVGFRTFEAKVDSIMAASLNACVHCGLCAESCHYYLATGDPATQPAYKVALVQAAFRRYHTFMGRAFPVLAGAQAFDAALVREWIDSLFGSCSMCSRCTLNCTVGLHIPLIVRAGRTAISAMGLVPPELQSTVDTAVQTGNNMGIPTEEWLDTVEWLDEELHNELGEGASYLPIDQEQATMLYVVNPREVKFFPPSLMAAARIFRAAKESWTFAADHFDVTNYGLFSGDDDTARLISGRLAESMRRLKCKTLVLGECGHGYAANRWEAPEWHGQTPPYDVKSVVELVAAYIRDGRITLDPSKLITRVTLHDPCNLVRVGGIIEEQRFILRHAVSDFVEMYPNRENNFCCGGGGGQLSMTRYAKRRLAAGRIKADQIRATGAKIVVAPCHNCIDQLSELNREYKLGVEVKTLLEIVADVLVDR